MVKDCGVGSKDIPHDLWVVLKIGDHNISAAGVFCNERYAKFWIKNTDAKDRDKYHIYHTVGNPEVNEQLQ